MTIHTVMIFTRFERFWHWSQAALIFTLLFTGAAIHGLHQLVDFRTAVLVHSLSAISLILLWLFAIFWHLTTGTWRHYIPTTSGLLRIARFYAYGIFKGEQHPYRKRYWRKHNPLQALTYLALKLFLFPTIWLSGLGYLFYGLWQSRVPPASGLLELTASIHTAAAYAILVFVILHVYLLTTSGSFLAHLKPMLSGYDKIELTDAEWAYLREDESNKIKQ
ncbi:cytochrome b/b6 domain-containing protein [Thiohalobacter sp. IOR34]|uniref:cytochrome b/b6 domain-containing protein n=1 Tax=Thiohalobacter sp. IOR34 TaxID=3057176 RepID=UPI0025AF07CC|nr:cytochrome b/b6 domain-containing protein [Thiohalobacter sp. IOR34]WJW74287.1 cytochrome b/b6 domain-containing protein [Thiohalobacter sp. IOR34]